MQDKIQCNTLYNLRILVPREQLIFRKASYGIIKDGADILLVSTKTTGKYWFPGGEMEEKESAVEALKREAREETGVNIEIKSFICAMEIFFFYDPLSKAYQNFSYFLCCEAINKELIDEHKIQDCEAVRPRWVNKKGLKREDFQLIEDRLWGVLEKHIFD